MKLCTTYPVVNCEHQCRNLKRNFADHIANTLNTKIALLPKCMKKSSKNTMESSFKNILYIKLKIVIDYKKLLVLQN